MLLRFLPGVVGAARQEPGTEVVVADNGSTDGSLEAVAREFPSVRLLALAENYGFAEGYNRALTQVDAEYMLLLNSDVQVADGWTEPLLQFMDAHPTVGAVCPKLLWLSKPDTFEYAGAAGGFLDRYGYPFCRGRVMSTLEQDSGQYDTPCPVLWATGAALLVRSKTWREVGGLDARFFAHQEEIDLCWRMRARGWQVWCVPQAAVLHVGGASLEQGNPRKTFLNFRNNLLLLLKNVPTDRELCHVLRVRRWLDYVAALQFLLCGDWGNFRAVLRARKAFKRLRGDFEADRRENLARQVEEQLAERKPWLLLWQYYVRRRRRWSELPA